MVRKVNRDARLESPGRRDRRMDKHARSNRNLKDDIRLKEFRKQFHHDVLPDLPKIPGYHVCWLTTTNTHDPIQARVRLGYEPVRPSEVPGWKFASVKSAFVEGDVISVNEMIAFKIPLDLYEEMMRIAHHERPLDEEDRLKQRVEQTKQAMRAAAGPGMANEIRVEAEDGMEELGTAPEPPSFAEAAGEY